MYEKPKKGKEFATGYETLKYEKKEGGVVIVTLNRPQRLNAISNQVLEELMAVLDKVEDDNDVRVLIITGSPRPDGRPCFSAGGDLKDQAQRDDKEEGKLYNKVRGMMDRGLEPGMAGICTRLETMGKISIAVIDGVCTTGGLELALGCDIRLVSTTSQISDLHVKNLGSIGGAGVTTRLVRTVGLAKAKEIMFTGEPIDGEEARRIGLANRVFPPDKLLPGALEFAQKIAAMFPEAVALGKASMNAAIDLDMGRALRYSYICRAALPVGAVGAKAFVEKRPPPLNHSRKV